MNILLDTVTFLWILEDSRELSATARAALKDKDNSLHLSAASAWEISVKHALGKLPLPQAPKHIISRQRAARGILELPISEAATFHLSALPALHRDPFDHIIICQAIEHGMVVLTPDPLIRAYPVRTLW